jgi:hypothetical protein
MKSANRKRTEPPASDRVPTCEGAIPVTLSPTMLYEGVVKGGGNQPLSAEETNNEKGTAKM